MVTHFLTPGSFLPAEEVISIHNFLIGGEGAGFFGNRVSNNANSLSMSAGYGTFNFGYLMPAGKRSVWYPMIGAGGGGFSLLIQQKNPGSSLENQLASPSGGILLESGGFLLNAQLGFQHFLCGKEKEGFFIGLKAGYRYSPTAWTLRASGKVLSEETELNMNGFYATLIIGGGSILKHQ